MKISLVTPAGKQSRAGNRTTAVRWAGILGDIGHRVEISEDGAGGIGLRVADRDDQVGSVTAGLRLSSVYRHNRFIVSQLEWMDGVWRPQLDLRWRQIVEGNERELEASLQGTPDSVPGFKVKGKEDQGGWEIGAGMSFIPTQANRFQFDLRYDAYVASHTLEHDLTFRVGMGF